MKTQKFVLSPVISHQDVKEMWEGAFEVSQTIKKLAEEHNVPKGDMCMGLMILSVLEAKGGGIIDEESFLGMAQEIWSCTKRAN